LSAAAINPVNSLMMLQVFHRMTKRRA